VAPLGDEPVQQDDIDRFLARQIAIDPDIWILDIDDPGGTGCSTNRTGPADSSGRRHSRRH
jgi:hypothetical protein